MKKKNYLKTGLFALGLILFSSLSLLADGTKTIKIKTKGESNHYSTTHNLNLIELEIELETIFDHLASILPEFADFSMDKELQVEPWMKTPLKMNNNLNDQELLIEDWMNSTHYLECSYPQNQEETKLSIETWMMQPLAQKNVSYDDPELEIEQWMLKRLY
jgi:hypothetical protein